VVLLKVEIVENSSNYDKLRSSNFSKNVEVYQGSFYSDFISSEEF